MSKKKKYILRNFKYREYPDSYQQNCQGVFRVTEKYTLLCRKKANPKKAEKLMQKTA